VFLENRLSVDDQPVIVLSWKTSSTLATLPQQPGFLTSSITAFVPLGTPSVQKWSL